MFFYSLLENLENNQNNISIPLSLHKNVQPTGFCDTYPRGHYQADLF